ncbi:MAG: ATP-dependent Clp protease ATP-binding subunit, partial [Megasphaera micronuciformis]|nr:ATP-dependent Clp protease ATP-binding subunit [Megasphaera micronuciformis]
AVAEGLAQKIADGHIPKPLADKRVISLSMASLVAGTKYRGEFEERIKQLLEAVKEDSSLILFIDELHQLIGAGSAEGTMDAADILKPALARGELQCIGATTTDEYRKYIEKDSALTRRFQPVRVEEPTEEEALSILQGLKGPYEDFHHVHFTDEALSDAVKLSARYIADRYLPDKAIDVIDEAASKVRLEHAASNGELKEAEDELARIEKKKSELSAAEKFEECAALRDKAKEMEERIRELKEAQKAKDRPQVLSSHIADVVSVWSGVPVQKIGTTEAQRLLNLEDELHKRVIGQDEAVRAVAKAMRRSGAGLKDPKRPVGSFLFLGPSGVGKTELARALAAGLFGDEEAMIRIDMSEFTESHAVARLVGSPPGYVGYDEGGELTDKVREKPYSVILFDEVEKASHNFFNLLLQILDDGRLTDSKGRTVDFRNTVIIMTGNLGANRLKSEVPTMGFNVGHESEDDRLHAFEGVKKDIMTDVRKFFKPEFLNRLDEILIFKPLAKDDLRHIVRLMIHTLEDKVKEKGVAVDVTEKATEVLVGEGTDFAYGARPLRRALQKLVEDKLSEYMLEGTLKEGMKVCIDSKDEKELDFQMT